MPNPATKRCPDCGFKNPPEATYCDPEKGCGQELLSVEQSGKTRLFHVDRPGQGPFHAGEVLAGRYQVEEEIGRGGMGVVYRVADTRFGGEEYALKVIAPDLMDDASARKRFMREVRVAQSLNHQHIVRVFTYDEHEPFCFYTMEHIAGQSLRHLLDTHRTQANQPRIPDMLGLFFQVLEALNHAHSLQPQVVHRDLSPENVMVDASGRVKVLDFGLPRVMSPSRLSSSAKVMGKAYYIAPEQLEGREVDHRADIYALGMLLYEMLTLKLVQGGGYQPVGTSQAGCPEWVDPLIRKCLQNDPGNRHGTIREMLEQVRGAPLRSHALDSRTAKIKKRAEQEEQAGSLEKAIHEWQVLLDLDPDNPEALAEQERLRRCQDLVAGAERQVEARDWLQAKETLEQALQLSPGNAAVQEHLEKVDTTLDEVEDLLLSAKRAQLGGDLFRAEEKIEALLKIMPGHGQALPIDEEKRTKKRSKIVRDVVENKNFYMVNSMNSVKSSQFTIYINKEKEEYINNNLKEAKSNVESALIISPQQNEALKLKKIIDSQFKKDNSRISLRKRIKVEFLFQKTSLCINMKNG